MKNIEILGYPSPNTYLDGRQCRYCKHPIADQESKSRDFCRKRVFSDGVTVDCKEKYWSPQRRVEAKTEKENRLRQEILKEDLEGLDYLNNIQISWNAFAEIGVQLENANNQYVSNEGAVFVFNQGYLVIERQTYKVTIKIN